MNIFILTEIIMVDNILIENLGNEYIINFI